MKIFWLGPSRKFLENYLPLQGDEAFFTEEPLRRPFPELETFDFLVSYGYRHLVSKDVLERFRGRAINLHISYLPWNRGADPNLWSFLEDTPKGVSIHHMTEMLDAGDILCQTPLYFEATETLRSSYEALSQSVEKLFQEYWPEIKRGKINSRPQPDGGSVHRKRDAEKYQYLLTRGWDTTVGELLGKALCKK